MNARIQLLVIVTAAAFGCDGNPAGPPYDPQIPAAWASAVTNPYFPLAPGAVYAYRSQSSTGVETDTAEVLAGTRVVQGVTAVLVHDRVFLDGALIEETYDYYAQDDAGNVWYLGEDSKELENGRVVSTEGSWEWGVNGALPGVIMWSDPAATQGLAYRQEFYRGSAEDWARVVSLDQSVTVPAGTFTGCIITEDWSGLEPAVKERKSYCPGVGVVLEVTVSSGERVELVSRATP